MMCTKKINKKFLLEIYKERIKKELEEENIKYILVNDKLVDIFVIPTKNYIGSIACDFNEDEEILIHYIFATYEEIKKTKKEIIKEVKKIDDKIISDIKLIEEDYLKTCFIAQKKRSSFSGTDVINDFVKLEKIWSSCI